MVDRCIKGYGTSDTSVENVGKTHLGELQGQDGARGGVGYNGFPPNREGGVLGYRTRRGCLEGLHGGG